MIVQRIASWLAALVNGERTVNVHALSAWKQHPTGAR